MFSVISLPVFMGLVFLVFMSFRDKRMTKKKQQVVGWSSMRVNSSKHTIYWRLLGSDVQ